MTQKGVSFVFSKGKQGRKKGQEVVTAHGTALAIPTPSRQKPGCRAAVGQGSHTGSHTDRQEHG